MFTLIFWKKATERALKSGANFVIAVLTAAGVSSQIDTSTAHVVNALTWDYKSLGGAFIAGMIISYLTSLGAAQIGTKNDPALYTPTP
jgi:hypothetical protein